MTWARATPKQQPGIARAGGPHLNSHKSGCPRSGFSDLGNHEPRPSVSLFPTSRGVTRQNFKPLAVHPLASEGYLEGDRDRNSAPCPRRLTCAGKTQRRSPPRRSSAPARTLPKHPGRRHLPAPTPRPVSRANSEDRTHASWLRPFPPDLHKQFRWGQDLNPEALDCPLEVSSIMRHNGLCLPVDRRFEHHFVVRISQLRPPCEPDLYWMNAQRQFRKKAVHILRGKTMLFAFEYGLIFQKQRGTRRKFNPVRGNFFEQSRARARP